MYAPITIEALPPTLAIKQNQGKQGLTLLALGLILLSLCTSVTAVGNIFGDDSAPVVEFLNVEEAFQPTITQHSDHFVVDWLIEPKYYLYQPRFGFSLSQAKGDNELDGSEIQGQAELGTATYTEKGILKNDEIFGEIEVYYESATIYLPYTVLKPGAIELVVAYQGCADAGLCYPPSKVKKKFSLKTNSGAAKLSNERQSSTDKPAGSNTAIPASPITDTQQNDTSSSSGIQSLLENNNAIVSLFIMFLLGLGLTFTPCILPMLPILSSVIVGQNKNAGARQGLILSITYVLGMALTYAAAGYLFGATGAKFQIIMQQPEVLWSFAVIFILLSLSMFGFYELQLPSAIQNRINDMGNKQSGGKLLGVFIMGMVSALVASPCISAPLAGALIYIAQTGDPGFGALALFAMGLGIGAPMIILATTGANFLPKAGAWMNKIKAVFGVLLLFVAIYLVKHLLPAVLLMSLWAGLLIVPAISLGVFDKATSSWGRFWQGMGVLALLYGAVLFVGGMSGSSDPFKPLIQTISSETHSTHLSFERVRSITQLNNSLKAAQQNGQAVMLDYYADWCVACVEMESTVFQDPTVYSLLGKHKLIQIDLTNNDEANDLLDQHELIGPPSILFFRPNGEEIKAARIVGEMKTARFTSHLQNKVLNVTP